jgi:hypothetical protein
MLNVFRFDECVLFDFTFYSNAMKMVAQIVTEHTIHMTYV